MRPALATAGLVRALRPPDEILLTNDEPLRRGKYPPRLPRDLDAETDSKEVLVSDPKSACGHSKQTRKRALQRPVTRQRRGIPDTGRCAPRRPVPPISPRIKHDRISRQHLGKINPSENNSTQNTKPSVCVYGVLHTRPNCKETLQEDAAENGILRFIAGDRDGMLAEFDNFFPAKPGNMRSYGF
ncbi:hypothetical protein NDU88_011651 [Pleurodeles waltl]|uniref:Uncharacterized protein n=1 Tax=Pleurodeles waltl TaxID=8319 RepID=A0AAV7QXV4_PLEWA|nr:hypothetical protein NDU88_011651 [Pleurodeles waltl]